MFSEVGKNRHIRTKKICIWHFFGNQIKQFPLTDSEQNIIIYLLPNNNFLRTPSRGAHFCVSSSLHPKKPKLIDFFFFF